MRVREDRPVGLQTCLRDRRVDAVRPVLEVGERLRRIAPGERVALGGRAEERPHESRRTLQRAGSGEDHELGEGGPAEALEPEDARRRSPLELDAVGGPEADRRIDLAADQARDGREPDHDVVDAIGISPVALDDRARDGAVGGHAREAHRTADEIAGTPNRPVGTCHQRDQRSLHDRRDDPESRALAIGQRHVDQVCEAEDGATGADRRKRLGGPGRGDELHGEPVLPVEALLERRVQPRVDGVRDEVEHDADRRRTRPSGGRRAGRTRASAGRCEQREKGERNGQTAEQPPHVGRRYGESGRVTTRGTAMDGAASGCDTR